MTSGLATLIPTSDFGVRLALGSRVPTLSDPVCSLEPLAGGIVRRRVVPRTGRPCQLRHGPEAGRGAVYPAPSAVLSVLALSLDPKQIFDSLSPYGEIGLILIIFAETGLLIGFFLPGDSLLFTAGLLANQGKLNLAAVLIGCFVAAVIGDQVGFTIGQKAGPPLFRRPDSRFFKQEYVDRTRASSSSITARRPS